MAATMLSVTTVVCRACGASPRQMIRGYCVSHYKRALEKGRLLKLVRPTPDELFESYLNRGAPTECWIWQGPLTPDGYGKARRDKRAVAVHRVTYEQKHGPVPNGLELDHLCRNRACGNPDHVEPVTHRENVLRGASHIALQAQQTHCKRGHELAGDDLYVWRGQRHCNACRRIRYAKRKGEPR